MAYFLPSHSPQEKYLPTQSHRNIKKNLTKEKTANDSKNRSTKSKNNSLRIGFHLTDVPSRQRWNVNSQDGRRSLTLATWIHRATCF